MGSNSNWNTLNQKKTGETPEVRSDKRNQEKKENIGKKQKN